MAQQGRRFDIRADVCQFEDLCWVLRIDASRLVRRLAEAQADEEDPSFTYQRILLHVKRALSCAFACTQGSFWSNKYKVFC